MAADLTRHWRSLIGGCLAVLAAGFLVPRLTKPPQLEENRALATAPSPPDSAKALRALPQAVDAYVADRFPSRAQLITGLNYLRYRLGVSGSPRVIVGRDGWLYYDDGSHLGPARNTPAFTDAQARDWLLALAGRTEWLAARGAHYVVLAGPDKEVVHPEHAPAWYPGPDPNRAAALLDRLNASALAGEFVYPAAELRRQAHWGLKVYSPLETHWTGLGAYYGYVALMRRLQAAGLTDGPRPLEAFREARVSPEKPRNLALMLGVASYVDADYPELLDPGLSPRTRFLTAVHADWTAPQIVETGQTGKPTLLLVRDSFSLALLPFLEGHFSRIILVHHQDGFWRPDLVETWKPDVVVQEAIESGVPFVMTGGPAPSPAARARIEQALAEPHRVALQAPAPPRPGRKIEGGPGADVLTGGDRDDTISGRAGDDRIDGGRGADRLRGGQGNDRIFGGDGDDWISGDRGDDTLTGGRGADTFFSFPGAGLDLVTDFAAVEGDRVELPAGTAYQVRQEGPDTVVEMTGARLVLRNVRLSNLPQGWLQVR